jgi:hypothetical protein
MLTCLGARVIRWCIKTQKNWERACHFYGLKICIIFTLLFECAGLDVCGAANQLYTAWSRNDLNFTQVCIIKGERRAVPQRRGIIIAKGIKYPWLEAKCSGARMCTCSVKITHSLRWCRVMAGTVTRARAATRSAPPDTYKAGCGARRASRALMLKQLGHITYRHAHSPPMPINRPPSHRVSFCNQQQSAFFYVYLHITHA